MSISQTRFDAIFNGQTSSVKKVYEAVPIAESWNVRKIMSELARNGVTYDQRKVMEYINVLCRASLVNELIKGEFRREAVKAAPDKESISDAMEVAIAAPVAKAMITIKAKSTPSPMDILGVLSVRAHDLAGLACVLASEIADAAIEIQQHIENSEADTQKFRQLQSLLKSIG